MSILMFHKPLNKYYLRQDKDTTLTVLYKIKCIFALTQLLLQPTIKAIQFLMQDFLFYL